MDPEVSEGRHVQARFTTREERLRIVDTPFSLPSGVGCEELNDLINNLLSSEDAEHSAIEFDFIVEGDLLRFSLEQILTDKSLSGECVLEIEYFRKCAAPEPDRRIDHDDWVGAVECLAEWILTGCYDSTAYIWNRQGKCIGSADHLSAVKSVAWIRQGDLENPLFLTGSQDETLVMWQWFRSDNVCHKVHTYTGHIRSVECLAVDSQSNRFCSGSWDRTVKVWTAVPDSDHSGDIDETQAKKARFSSKPKRKPRPKTPLATLSGHSQSVSSVQWLSLSRIASASWDHSIRLWDVEAATFTSVLMGSNVFNDISYSQHCQLLASANADRFVRLWDPRSETAVVQSMLSSHSGWVVSVNWSPTNCHHLVSGSFDKSVCLWDIRSTKVPLFRMSGHKDKVMCTDWSESDLIVSGAADNSLRLYQVPPSSDELMLVS